MTEMIGMKEAKQEDYTVKGKERMQGKLCCVGQSAKCGKRSMKYEASVLEKTKLVEIFRGRLLDLKLRGKILLAFCTVSTGIKYKMLCPVWAMW